MERRKAIIIVSVVIVFSTLLAVGISLMMHSQNRHLSVVGNKEICFFYYSNYCPHCERVLPLVRAKASSLNITFCCLDTNFSINCSRVAKEINLYAVPTLVVLKNGEKIVLVGEDQIKNFLNKTK